MPKILVAPGAGDIHWVMLKLEAFIKTRLDGEIPEIWVWCEAKSTQRAREYVERIPFVKWGGYFDAVAHHSMGDQVFVRGKPWCVKDWQAFDYFVAFNQPLGAGVMMDAIWPECDVNWDYKLKLTEEDLVYGERLWMAHRKYVAVSFFGHSFYKKWLDNFSTVEIWNLLDKLAARGLKVVLTGAKWDVPFMRQFIQPNYVNLVGETTMGQLLGLMKSADAFIGFAAGNGMLAQHLGTKTFMLWHPRQWTPEFMTNWVDPKKVGSTYHALDLRNPCTPYILENLQ